MLYETLELVERRLYVCHHSTSHSEPVIIRHYYPVSESILDSWEMEYFQSAIGQRLTYHQATGQYWCESIRRYIRCKDGGQTLPNAALTQREAVPAPKRAKQTRWQNGRWEKYTQREGWVAA